MLGKGFLGTRADWLMDLVLVALIVVIPAIVVSWRKARQRQYQKHKNIQFWLAVTLGITVLLFELDIRLAGGTGALTKHSAYAGTWLLTISFYVHLLIAVSTAILWATLIIISFRRFDKPPRPNHFSRQHKRWGRIAMILMILTGLTGIEIYILGFAM